MPDKPKKASSFLIVLADDFLGRMTENVFNVFSGRVIAAAPPVGHELPVKQSLISLRKIATSDTFFLKKSIRNPHEKDAGFSRSAD